MFPNIYPGKSCLLKYFFLRFKCILFLTHLLNVKFDIFTHIVLTNIFYMQIMLTKERHAEYELIYERDSFPEREGSRLTGERGQISVCDSNMVRPPHQFSSAGERRAVSRYVVLRGRNQDELYP